MLALGANAGDKSPETFVSVYLDLLKRIEAAKKMKARAKRVSA